MDLSGGRFTCAWADFLSGRLGGELVFGDGVGVAPTGQGPGLSDPKNRVAQLADSESEHREHYRKSYLR